ncbi:MAG: DUF4212 domain-containing protein [Cyanobacteria bacterium SBLK]|nr:DUF4212 domain-containing protein [Cyanobacteria bacterium SBLK]
MDKEQRNSYWRANIALIRNLLIVWAIASIGASILFVTVLNNIRLGNLPFGFWMAQQGTIFIFVILIFIYAFQMDKLDRKYKVDADDSNKQTPLSPDSPPTPTQPQPRSTPNPSQEEGPRGETKRGDQEESNP